MPGEEGTCYLVKDCCGYDGCKERIANGWEAFFDNEGQSNGDTCLG